MKPKTTLAELKAHKNMSTKHTPGKLQHVAGLNNFYIRNSKGDYIAKTTGCSVEDEENAKLFASAPALLLDRDRLREALTAISNIAGNLSDDVLDAIGGVNDGRDRAIKLIAARQIARAALNREGK